MGDEDMGRPPQLSETAPFGRAGLAAPLCGRKLPWGDVELGGGVGEPRELPLTDVIDLADVFPSLRSHSCRSASARFAACLNLLARSITSRCADSR